MVAQFGLPVVRAYMRHVQDNAEESVRRVLVGARPTARSPTRWTTARWCAWRSASTARGATATIDFTGTSAQLPSNFNAPSAVCKAAVLYVFRTLVDDEIPMNAGCLKPLTIVIPEGSHARAALPGRRGRRQRRDLAGASPTRCTARSACWRRRRAR